MLFTYLLFPFLWLFDKDDRSTRRQTLDLFSFVAFTHFALFRFRFLSFESFCRAHSDEKQVLVSSSPSSHLSLNFLPSLFFVIFCFPFHFHQRRSKKKRFPFCRGIATIYKLFMLEFAKFLSLYLWYIEGSNRNLLLAYAS